MSASRPPEEKRKAGRPRNPAMPQPRSYRLPTEVVALIERLAAELGVTQAAVVERAVRQLAGQPQPGELGPLRARVAELEDVLRIVRDEAQSMLEGKS